MKTIKQKIIESNLQPIDDQWLNDEKPVMTIDGRPVKILSINYDKVPNIILGQVEVSGKLVNFEWEDDGTCVSAQDKYGNPTKPEKSYNLVKSI